MNKQETYLFLKEHHVTYDVYEHGPVYTVEEMEQLELPHKDKIVKNLFLRDDKGENYYLVTLFGHKRMDLKALRTLINSRKLSFANPERLNEFLALTPGSVTPLGILNNEQKNVIMIFDSDLKGELLGIHPMENTATIFLTFEELLPLIQEHGNPVMICSLP